MITDSVSHCCNQYQIQICILAWKMSGEFFYNFSVFVEIEKSLNGQNCFEYIKSNTGKWVGRIWLITHAG